MINNINKIIDELIKKGCNISDKRDYLLNNSLDILENDNYDSFIYNLEKNINSYINNETGIKNLSIGIKINDIKLVFNKGNIDFDNTVYDIASITKFFTLKLCYEFNKLGILDFNSNIKDIDSNFINLESYKIIDILKMHGFIETEGKLSETNSKEELIERLKTVKVKDLEKNLYTDIGFIILPFILEKLYEIKYDKFLTFNELCKKYIFDKYDLKNTGFNLKNKIIVGNDYGNLPSDKKAKLLNGICGAAGIFTNVYDLLHLSDSILNYTFFDRDFIKEILNYHFLDNLNRKRSYGGIYLHSNNKSYAPIYYSSETIAHQGYTGSTISFDFKTNISQVILVDSLNKDNKKNELFFEFFHKLHDEISLASLVIYIVDVIK